MKAVPVRDNCASDNGAEKDSVPVASPCISVQPPQCHTALRSKLALKEGGNRGRSLPPDKKFAIQGWMFKHSFSHAGCYVVARNSCCTNPLRIRADFLQMLLRR